MMETFSKGIGKYNTGVEMWWKITKIEAPKRLLKDKDEMMVLLKEAFDAHGTSGKRDCVTKVNFDFIATPWFICEGNK
ncbi:hypothetical protein LY28_03298 [Ruminiclostridium sufflavum DSM 19573]|uniref:Uncharacterized protein n=1 Tax=Ruminiclostridium sufflavum DSM 19573 TaxID=1121337 RepID=A0A318XGG1_9FIRM|nr:hypothetical protein [Ruminiclostridium sufflavum]PYG85610.1 hypothetical protein LY28_03298 [Ruminiclostridium sufflavum DSM 19573]